MRQLRWLLAATLIAVGSVAYWPSFQAGFVFDDPAHIHQNKAIRSLPALLPALAATNRPVIYVTLWANYTVGGLNVIGYHVVNFAIHLASGILLWRIVAGTLEKRGGKNGTGPICRNGPHEWSAFAVAAIWIVHPLQTQAVTYIIQRCESLMAFFYLLSLYCLIRAARSAGFRIGTGIKPVFGWLGSRCEERAASPQAVGFWGLADQRCASVPVDPSHPLPKDASSISATILSRSEMPDKTLEGPPEGGTTNIRANSRFFWYAAAILAVSLGMGCKEVMITAPLVLLLYDRVFLAASWRDVLGRRWVFYAAMAPATAWLLLRSVAKPAGADISAGFHCTHVTPWEYLRSQPGVILHYLRLAVLPDRLCLDYKWPVADGWTEILLPLVAVSAILIVGVWAWRRRTPVGFLILSFFVLLAPTSSIMPIADLAVEHRMYLPLVPITVLAVFGFLRFLRLCRPAGRSPNRVLAGLAVLLVVGLFSVRTYVRNRVYCDPAVLWSNTIRQAPHNDRAHHNLAMEMAARGGRRRAFELYRRALELNPQNHRTHISLARLHWLVGDGARAEEHARLAVRVNPTSGLARYTFGSILARRGKYRQAIEQLDKTIEICPQQAAAYYNLGLALADAGDIRQALASHRRAVELKPDEPKYVAELRKCRDQWSAAHQGGYRAASLPHADQSCRRR